mgnify:CR=1 FL=1
MEENKRQARERAFELGNQIMLAVKENEDLDRRPGQVRAIQCLVRLIRDYEFNNVLDIGTGFKRHATIFEKFGKKVITCDFGKQYDPDFLGDFIELDNQFPDNYYDCIWASHVLEHQPNASLFLSQAKKKLKDGGILAITVPPLKHQIVGGHVSLWNLGLLFYNLVCVGFDCRNAIGGFYDYDVSIITKKQDIGWDEEKLKQLDLCHSSVADGTLSANGGDFYKLKRFFPQDIPWVPHGPKDQSFNGNLLRIGGW